MDRALPDPVKSLNAPTLDRNLSESIPQEIEIFQLRIPGPSLQEVFEWSEVQD